MRNLVWNGKRFGLILSPHRQRQVVGKSAIDRYKSFQEEQESLPSEIHHGIREAKGSLPQILTRPLMQRNDPSFIAANALFLNPLL